MGAKKKFIHFYGYFTDIFLLDDVTCNGNEGNLAECRHSSWRHENCGSGEHLYISCGLPEPVGVGRTSMYSVGKLLMKAIHLLVGLP